MYSTLYKVVVSMCMCLRVSAAGHAQIVGHGLKLTKSNRVATLSTQFILLFMVLHFLLTIQRLLSLGESNRKVYSEGTL